MRDLLAVLVVGLVSGLLGLSACGSGTPGGGDLASVHADLTMSLPADFAGSNADLSSSHDLSGGGDMVCEAPAGADCPPTAGNCNGIGKPCTQGGGECAGGNIGGAANACDKDMSSSGVGACINIGHCTHGVHQCGTGATCCQTSDTFFIGVCIANQCLPTGCTAE